MLQETHQYIVTFYGSCVVRTHLMMCCTTHDGQQVPPYLYLVYEYCDLGSLFDVLHSSDRSLSASERTIVALNAAKAVAFLHEQCSPPFVHRDIKSLNFLAQSHHASSSTAHEGPFIVKLADFGESITVDQCEEQIGTVSGSPLWMAPEVADGRLYTTAADVVSLEHCYMCLKSFCCV